MTSKAFLERERANLKARLSQILAVATRRYRVGVGQDPIVDLNEIETLAKQAAQEDE